MNTANVKIRKTMSFRKKSVIALAVALFLLEGWWLISDREPTSKEMTWAYRKYVVAAADNANLKEIAELRQRLHTTELKKQRCDKRGQKRYRCEASVVVDDQPVNARHLADNAVYGRDSKGWLFSATGENTGRQNVR